MGEVEGVPELAVDELARVEVDADDSAPRLGTHAQIEPLKLGLSLVKVGPVIVGAELAPFLPGRGPKADGEPW